MGRSRRSVPVEVLLLLASTCASCGGVSLVPQPPPLVPDFSRSLSSNSISVPQGSASSAVNVSINPVNGFANAVQVTLSALPAGVTSNPASPFTVAAGASTAVVFGVAANAPTGSFTVSAQGTSGALSHSASLALTMHNT